jgi:hypothetical protein
MSIEQLIFSCPDLVQDRILSYLHYSSIEEWQKFVCEFGMLDLLHSSLEVWYSKKGTRFHMTSTCPLVKRALKVLNDMSSEKSRELCEFYFRYIRLKIERLRLTSSMLQADRERIYLKCVEFVRNLPRTSCLFYRHAMLLLSDYIDKL